jgi:hypothetical protein
MGVLSAENPFDGPHFPSRKYADGNRVEFEAPRRMFP